MKPYICLSFLILSICFSCKQIYNADIDAKQDALVVEGLITDSATAYAVRLTRALPYDISASKPYVTKAKVSIYDDANHRYKLTESGKGVYYTDPAQLVGKPGITYTLHIETEDGNIYESTPQLMYPNNFADSAYARFTTRETLLETSNGGKIVVTTQGIDFLFNIKNKEDPLPRFRFELKVTSEYEGGPPSKDPNLPPPAISYYCWENFNPNNLLINLTDEKYATTSLDITSHSVAFIPTYLTHIVRGMDTLFKTYLTFQIIRVTRYRVNQQAYNYYKNINTSLSAEGKILDPTAIQFTGNITCINHPDKLALGFFEASSVHTRTYYVHTGTGHNEIYGYANVDIPPADCVSSPNSYAAPDFWIY